MRKKTGPSFSLLFITLNVVRSFDSPSSYQCFTTQSHYIGFHFDDEFDSCCYFCIYFFRFSLEICNLWPVISANSSSMNIGHEVSTFFFCICYDDEPIAVIPVWIGNYIVSHIIIGWPHPISVDDNCMYMQLPGGIVNGTERGLSKYA